jgi:hypothetical protein
MNCEKKNETFIFNLVWSFPAGNLHKSTEWTNIAKLISNFQMEMHESVDLKKCKIKGVSKLMTCTVDQPALVAETYKNNSKTKKVHFLDSKYGNLRFY